jgi:hypothetical protein
MFLPRRPAPGAALAALCLLIPWTAARAQPPNQGQSVEALVLQSNFIFRGTVQKTEGVTSKLLTDKEAKGAVAVRLDEALKVPPSFGRPEDFAQSRVTVLVLPKKPGLRQGQRVLFFADADRAGQNEAVARERDRIVLADNAAAAPMMMAVAGPDNKVEPVKDPVKHVWALAQDAPRLQFQAQAAAADRVVAGTVIDVVRAPDVPLSGGAEEEGERAPAGAPAVAGAPRPPGAANELAFREHDPDWHLAIIQVGPTDPTTKPERVGVLFPASPDILWQDAPKFSPPVAGKPVTGLWSLKKVPDREGVAGGLAAAAAIPNRMPIYTALDPHDFYPLTSEQAREAAAQPKGFLSRPATILKGGGAAPGRGNDEKKPEAPGKPEAKESPQPEPLRTLPVPREEPRAPGEAAGGNARGRGRDEQPDQPEADDDQGPLLVDLIPAFASGETQQDSEPFLAVHPKGKVLLASAFTGSAAGQRAPVFVSTDRGRSWAMNLIVPSSRLVADQTYAFGGEESLYGAVITRPGLHIPVLETKDPNLASVLRIIHDPGPPLQTPQGAMPRTDQPFLQTSEDGSRIYVGENNFNPAVPRHTASLRVSVDGGNSFRNVWLEARNTLGQDAPSIRPSVARDGTVYVAFLGWRQAPGGRPVGDVVVLRDDQGATGAQPFNNFRDPNDNLPGRLVARNRVFPFDPRHPRLGQERIGSSLSLAVDPNHSETVYLAWADLDTTTGAYTVRVCQSQDRGENWTQVLQPIPSATNPALAVADDGTVALLYQQLAGEHTRAARWETHLVRSRNGFQQKDDQVLSRVPTQGEPAARGLPYLGDYAHLLAVGNTFYGIFSASNAPLSRNFPALKPIYQRKNTWDEALLDNSGNHVTPSIDPFFFRMPSLGLIAQKPPSKEPTGNGEPSEPPEPGSKLDKIEQRLSKVERGLDKILKILSDQAPEGNAAQPGRDLPRPTDVRPSGARSDRQP